MILLHSTSGSGAKRPNLKKRGAFPLTFRTSKPQKAARDTFAHHKLNHMRLHYQFVMANERRALYDYFMLLAGPAPFEYLSTIPNGALDVYGEDGSYREPAKGGQ